MQEVWKDLPGNKRYRVSTLGRIMSRGQITKFTRNGKTFKRHTRDWLLKPSRTKNGYLTVLLTTTAGKKTCKVHVLVSLAFYGPVPRGKVVNHKDTVKTNNVVSNLEYVTHLENSNHAKLNGLLNACKGVDHHKAKLTEKDVKYIRANSHRSKADLARKFGVAVTLIYKIIARQNWKHI